MSNCELLLIRVHAAFSLQLLGDVIGDLRIRIWVYARLGLDSDECLEISGFCRGSRLFAHIGVQEVLQASQIVKCFVENDSLCQLLHKVSVDIYVRIWRCSLGKSNYLLIVVGVLQYATYRSVSV